MNFIFWCKAILLFLNCNKKPSSSFAKKPLLILCNHQSFMDIVFLVYLFQCGFILKSSLMLTPFGWNSRLFGSIALTAPVFLALKKLEKYVQKDYNRILVYVCFLRVLVVMVTNYCLLREVYWIFIIKTKHRRLF